MHNKGEQITSNSCIDGMLSTSHSLALTHHE